MIGIILWAIVIIVIAFGTTPEAIPFLLFVGLPVAAGVYFFVDWLKDFFTSSPYERSYPHTPTTSNPERERLIDEWEKKWGRKHPTRINK